MRWYEYKMEADDLHAPEDLKAKLLAMADTLPEEEKNRPTRQSCARRNRPKRQSSSISLQSRWARWPPVWPCAWWATVP